MRTATSTALVAAMAWLVASGCPRAAPAPPKPSTPTACVVPDEVFAQGLNGTCDASEPGRFQMQFRDDEGTELFGYTWVSAERGVDADCAGLCSASIMYWAGAPQAALLVGPHLVKEPATCDGGAYDCLGACGPGCAATIAFPLGSCGSAAQCIETEFRGYTKTCCQNHDVCVAAATTAEQHIACAMVAYAEGCVLKDAWGGGTGPVWKGRACLPP